jgi:hypothetical protein
MSNSIPNLDAMSADDLMKFWSRYHRATRKDAAELIGDKRPGYTNLAATLAAYAVNKSTAMTCRLEGKIQSAKIYEDAADMIYAGLPEDLRW